MRGSLLVFQQCKVGKTVRTKAPSIIGSPHLPVIGTLYSFLLTVNLFRLVMDLSLNLSANRSSQYFEGSLYRPPFIATCETALPFSPPVVYTAVHPCSHPPSRTHRQHGTLPRRLTKTDMEDAHTGELQLAGDNLPNNAFFAVYDGHRGMSFLVIAYFAPFDLLMLRLRAGRSAAEYAAKSLVKLLTGEQSYGYGDYRDSLKKAFLAADRYMCQGNVPHNRPSFS